MYLKKEDILCLMKSKEWLKSEILQYLEENKDKENISKFQIAKDLKENPATISKYIHILVAEGKVEITQVGSVHLIKLKGGMG